MADEKEFDIGMNEEGFDGGEERPSGTASRARNRTVMLTPEITSQVRSRLSRVTERPSMSDPLEEYNEPAERSSHPVTMVEEESSETTVHSKVIAQTLRQRPVEQAVMITPPPMAPVAPVRAPVPVVDESCDFINWQKKTRLAGVLVSYDNDPLGEIFELRSGRMIITSEVPTGGNFLFLPSESVSPMHAIVRIGEEGDVQVLDQLSEFGTTILRGRLNDIGESEEIQLAGEKSVLEHGDSIKFGDREFQLALFTPKLY